MRSAAGPVQPRATPAGPVLIAHCSHQGHLRAARTRDSFPILMSSGQHLTQTVTMVDTCFIAHLSPCSRWPSSRLPGHALSTPVWAPPPRSAQEGWHARGPPAGLPCASSSWTCPGESSLRPSPSPPPAGGWHQTQPSFNQQNFNLEKDMRVTHASLVRAKLGFQRILQELLS